MGVVKLQKKVKFIPVDNGIHDFVITDIDDKIDDFGKISIAFKLLESDKKLFKTFYLTKSGGKEVNEVGLRIFSDMCKAALQIADDSEEEIDVRSLVGCCLTATVCDSKNLRDDGVPYKEMKSFKPCYAVVEQEEEQDYDEDEDLPF